MRLVIAAAIGHLQTGCATVLLPSPQTEGPFAGRCYRKAFIPVLDYGVHWIAQGIDGWRCDGLAEGDLARPEDGPRPTKTATPAAAPAAPAPAPELTWATGF